MSFQEFARSIPGLLTGIGALLSGSAALVVALRKPASRTDDAQPEEPRRPRSMLWLILLAGVLLGIGLTMVIAHFVLGRATVEITSPQQSVVVTMDPGGSASFTVQGTSSGVAGHAKRRIYLLVHPERPSAPGWWIQPEVIVERDGQWSGVGWIGNAQAPASTGDQFALMAIVAPYRDALPVDEHNVPRVPDQGRLEPIATSEVVRVRITTVR